jgi:hypothetical protein
MILPLAIIPLLANQLLYVCPSNEREPAEPLNIKCGCNQLVLVMVDRDPDTENVSESAQPSAMTTLQLTFPVIEELFTNSTQSFPTI